jgi:hypothetical protein
MSQDRFNKDKYRVSAEISFTMRAKDAETAKTAGRMRLFKLFKEPILDWLNLSEDSVTAERLDG